MEYKELIDAVIKRQLGVLGKKRLAKILKAVAMPVSNDFKFEPENGAGTIDDLERLMKELKKRYGPIAVLGCKISVGRMARDSNLKLPPILK